MSYRDYLDYWCKCQYQNVQKRENKHVQKGEYQMYNEAPYRHLEVEFFCSSHYTKFTFLTSFHALLASSHFNVMSFL